MRLISSYVYSFVASLAAMDAPLDGNCTHNSSYLEQNTVIFVVHNFLNWRLGYPDISFTKVFSGKMAEKSARSQF